MSESEVSATLLDEIVLGSARGGAKPAKLELEIVRSLTADDLPVIRNPTAVSAPAQTIKQLRSSHHRLAELIAKGEPGPNIQLITGYSASYISILKTDPTFVELVEYYKTQKELIFVDAMERVRDLGIDASEKLRDRLDDPNVTWTNRELMELVEKAIITPEVAKKAAAAPPGPSVNLQVQFVGAPQRGPERALDVTPEPQVLEAKPR